MPRPRAALAALAVLAAVACNPDDVVHHVGWFATMRHQRSFKPYSRNLAPVPGTVLYDPRFTNDKFGIFVPCAPERAGQVETLLRQAGAEEVRRA